MAQSGAATLNLPPDHTRMKAEVKLVIELASTQLEWAELIKTSQSTSWNTPCVQSCSDFPVSDAAHFVFRVTLLACLPACAADTPVCNRLLLRRVMFCTCATRRTQSSGQPGAGVVKVSLWGTALVSRLEMKEELGLIWALQGRILVRGSLRKIA